MKKERSYLSDDELAALIAGVEEDLVPAPAGFEREVRKRIRNREKKRKLQFYEYCLRVGFGVAAAIAVMFVKPSFERKKPPLPTKTEVMAALPVVESREAVLSKQSLSDQVGNYIRKYNEGIKEYYYEN